MKGIEEKVRSIMTRGASGHRASAPIFFLLAALIALASGLAGPTSASAKTLCTPQNRVWENSAGMLQSRPVQTPQSLELQRENSIGRYDSAVGDTLAAETTTNAVGALEDWSNVDHGARYAALDNAWETDNAINIHGNAANSPRTAYLYGLYDKATNQLLKWGISQKPATRYSRAFMEDKVIRPIMSGSRSLMLQQERSLVETQPGPLNFEPWAGSRAGGQ